MIKLRDSRLPERDQPNARLAVRSRVVLTDRVEDLCVEDDITRINLPACHSRAATDLYGEPGRL